MPKTKKNKSKDNVVPFNKPKTDKEADEKELNSFYGPIDEQLNS